ncbi:hypothetical protein B296_00029986 [Ensete ventricosum]|uniref:Uncharacterized protein n=1 Tax=Ensete ventricosum TaxID=4639 RepID=A0A426XCZ8_ENSVE|nr:hypothetical protein B296_00029986 [Ensete ventricosum]
MTKKKLSRHLAIIGWHRPRFFLLFLIPCFFFRHRSQAVPLGNGRRWSKSTVTDLFRAVLGRKQSCIVRYRARSRVSPDNG